jgi:hypothetical protein
MVLKKFSFEKQSCQMGPGLIIILSEKARHSIPPARVAAQACWRCFGPRALVIPLFKNLKI